MRKWIIGVLAAMMGVTAIPVTPAVAHGAGHRHHHHHHHHKHKKTG
jgi:hypothetical protein